MKRSRGARAADITPRTLAQWPAIRGPGGAVTAIRSDISRSHLIFVQADPTINRLAFRARLSQHMTGSGPVVGWEGALVGVDNVKVKCFPGPNTPERRSVTLRAEFEVMPAVALGKHFTTASAEPELPEPITLLAENLQDSVTNDPSVSPLAHSFCRAARGRCKCRTSGAGGVLRGAEHHFLSNLFGT